MVWEHNSEFADNLYSKVRIGMDLTRYSLDKIPCCYKTSSCENIVRHEF